MGRWMRTLWTGPVRELSQRPNADISTSCSAGVRSAKFTVEQAASIEAPSRPESSDSVLR